MLQVKPENLLITTGGDVKIIDFGAAVDMCTGINFNPAVGMLDPRYRSTLSKPPPRKKAHGMLLVPAVCMHTGLEPAGHGTILGKTQT